MLGILLIDKPAGVTSHDVVNEVRRRFGTRRVGHAGTLDPAATGLLIVAVGPATRFLQYLPLEPKEYAAEITFGIETNTQDSEGEVLAHKPVPTDLGGRLNEVLPRFTGLVEQMPPMYSAVKKAGKPLYVYAREGKEVERAPRTIHIGSIKIEGIEGPRVKVRVTCSGGTYMRTLAHDLGRALGCGAYLSALNRDRVGKFLVGDAVPLRDVGPERIVSLREALPPVPLVSLNDLQTENVRQGRAVTVGRVTHAGLAGLVGPDGAVIGIGRVFGNLLQPECVIPTEAANG